MRTKEATPLDTDQKKCNRTNLRDSRISESAPFGGVVMVGRNYSELLLEKRSTPFLALILSSFNLIVGVIGAPSVSQGGVETFTDWPWATARRELQRRSFGGKNRQAWSRPPPSQGKGRPERERERERLKNEGRILTFRRTCRELDSSGLLEFARRNSYRRKKS